LRKPTHACAAAALLFLLLGPVPLFGQPVQADAARVAGDMILCDCGCHPQSVNDCACGRAAEMRQEMTAFAAQGLTSEQVVAKYVEASGEQILVVPTANRFNLVAWLGPFFGLAAGAVWLGFALRRWQQRAVPESTPASPAAATPQRATDPYVARLERELKDLE
jgi:cytochrome c-type biogenesis protein CcmH/NrfF